MFCSIYIFRLSWETLHRQNPDPAVTKSNDAVEIEREVCVRCAGPRCTCPCAPIRCTRTLHAHVDLHGPLCSISQSGNVVQDAVAAEDDADTQEELHTLYKPQRLDDPDAGPHPDAVVETQAFFALQRTPADLDAEKDRLFVAQRSACVPACLSMPCPRRPMVCVWQYGRCSRWRPSHHRRSQ